MQTIDIDEFPLKWRWTDERYSLLSKPELAKIRPLTKKSAKLAWDESLELLDSSKDFSPSTKLFSQI